MTVDQRARQAAAAVRTARAAAEFASAPPSGGPPRRSRLALATAGALAVLLVVGIPAALLLADRGLDPLEGTTPPAGSGQPADPPVAPADPTRAVRQPIAAELDSGIRYLRTYGATAQDGQQFLFATEQWLSPDGLAAGASEASPPSPAAGPIAIDTDEAEALLDGAAVLPAGGPDDGGATFGFADRALPTEPAALEAALSGPGMANALFSPGDALTPDGSALDRRGLILRTAPSMMTPVLDPAVAAAFFELVAGLEGAVVREAADPLGRPAVEIAVPVPMFGDAGEEVGRLAFVTWFDPDTKLVVGQRSELVAGIFPGSGYGGPIATLFVVAERGVVDEMPATPAPDDWAAPSTTIPPGAEVVYVAAGGGAFGSSQIQADEATFLVLSGGLVDCGQPCGDLELPRTVHLTIDPVLQSVLEQYMTTEVSLPAGASATAVVLDSETGAVQALAGDASAAAPAAGVVGVVFERRDPVGTAAVLGLDPDDRASAAGLAATYAAVANGGRRVVPHLVAGIVSGGGTHHDPALPDDRVADEAAVASARERLAASVQEDVGARVAFDGPAYGQGAASTRTAWYAGSAGGLTAVVWIGGIDAAVPLIGGGDSAADVWADLMVMAGAAATR